MINYKESLKPAEKNLNWFNRLQKDKNQTNTAIPVLVEEGHLPAHGPAWSVDAVLWYFDRRETLTGQCLQRSKHGAAYKRLAQLWLVNE